MEKSQMQNKSNDSMEEKGITRRTWGNNCVHQHRDKQHCFYRSWHVWERGMYFIVLWQ